MCLHPPRRSKQLRLQRERELILPIELDDGEAEKVIVITDAIPINKKRKAVEKAVRTTLARMLPPGMNYRILHHQSRSHYGLQVADYCCWRFFGSGREGRAFGTTASSPAVCDEFEILRGEMEG